MLEKEAVISCNTYQYKFKPEFFQEYLEYSPIYDFVAWAPKNLYGPQLRATDIHKSPEID